MSENQDQEKAIAAYGPIADEQRAAYERMFELCKGVDAAMTPARALVLVAKESKDAAALKAARAHLRKLKAIKKLTDSAELWTSLQGIMDLAQSKMQ